VLTIRRSERLGPADQGAGSCLLRAGFVAETRRHRQKFDPVRNRAIGRLQSDRQALEPLAARA
jgi:hypothetical protein